MTSATSENIKNLDKGCNPSTTSGKVRNIYTGRLVNENETARQRIQKQYGTEENPIVFHHGLAGKRRHIDRCLEIPSKATTISVTEKVLEIYNKCKDKCSPDQACNLDSGRCLALDQSGKPKSEKSLKNKWGNQYRYDGELRVVGKRSQVDKLHQLLIPSKPKELKIKSCPVGKVDDIEKDRCIDDNMELGMIEVGGKKIVGKKGVIDSLLRLHPDAKVLRCPSGHYFQGDSRDCIPDKKELAMVEYNGRKMIGNMRVMVKILEKYPNAKLIRRGESCLETGCGGGLVCDADEERCVTEESARQKAQMMIGNRRIVGKRSTLEKLKLIYPEGKIVVDVKYPSCVEDGCERGKVCDTEIGCVKDSASNKIGKSILDLKGRKIIGKPEVIKALQQKLGGKIIVEKFKGKLEEEELLIPTLPTELEEREIVLTEPTTQIDFDSIISETIKKAKEGKPKEVLVIPSRKEITIPTIITPEQRRAVDESIEETFEKCLATL